MILFTGLTLLTIAITTRIISGLSIQPECSRRQILSRTAGAASSVPAFSVVSQHLGISFANAADLDRFADGPRGLKYIVTKEGNSDVPKPTRAQEVKTSYTLFLGGFGANGGRKVDSSKGPLGEKPFKFLAGVGQVIPGWDLAILDMREGEARRLVVPASLGYGEKGAGGKIPGGATLYFDVELVEIGKMPKIGLDQEKWLAEHPI